MKTLLIFVTIVAYYSVLGTPLSPRFPAPNVGPKNPPPAGEQRGARTVNFENEANVGAGYRYSYQIDNGISAQESGALKDFGGNPPAIVNVAQGAFQWTSPEGKVISISYIADENGYQPAGDAIPQ